MTTPASPSAASRAGDSTRAQPVVRAAWFGWVLALGASSSFSIAPPVARGVISAGMDPTMLLLARFVITVAMFAVTIAVIDPAHFRLTRHGALYIGAAGALNGIAMLCFFWALTRLDASVASMILAVLPLMVLLLLALRGERFTRRNALRVVLALGGVYLLIGPGGAVDLVGVGLMLIAVSLFAVQLVIIQWHLQGYHTLTVALYLAVAMLIAIGAWWFLQGAQWQTPTRHGWWAIGALAVISTYQARMLFYAAIQHLGSGQIVLLLPLELLLTVTWSVLFLGERFSPLQLVGGALILLSALLAIRRLGRARWRPRWRFLTRT